MYISMPIYIYLKSPFAYAENDDKPGVRYPTDVNSEGFLFQPKAFRVTHHTEICDSTKQSLGGSLYINVCVSVSDALDYSNVKN